MAVRTSSLFYREKCGVNSDVVIKIFHSNEQVSMGHIGRRQQARKLSDILVNIPFHWPFVVNDIRECPLWLHSKKLEPGCK